MTRICFFAAGCALLGALLWYAGAGSVGHVLAILGVPGVILVAILHLPLIVVMGLAWHTASGGAAPRRAFVMARFIRDAAAEVLPFSQLGGFAVAIRALSLKGVAPFIAGLSLFADLAAEFAAKLPYVVAGLALLLSARADFMPAVPLLVGTGVIAGVIALALRFRGSLLARFEKVTRSALRPWVAQVPAAGEIAGAFQRGRIVPSFTLHVLCWFLGAAETWLVFALMHDPVTLAQALIIDSLANTLRTFAFFIPAAAGAQEGAYIIVGALVGVPPATALAFSLARRAREFVLGIPGLILWQVWEARVPGISARRP